MKIYVSAPLAAEQTVRIAQRALVGAGHKLALDWTQDTSFAEDYASRPVTSGRMASQEVAAVMEADALLVLATEHDGRGMFVELGLALARAVRGEAIQIAVIGHVRHESVFYFHPAVRRFPDISAWLAANATSSHR